MADFKHNFIKHNPIEELLQATPQANGLLFHALKDGNSAYHIGVAFSLQSDVEKEDIFNVWHQIQVSQPALRSVFVWQGIRVPHQMIYASPRIPLEYICIDSINAIPSIKNRSIKQPSLDWLAQSKATPFALNKEVFRIVVFHDIHAGTLNIAFSFHHILMDGWSSSLLISLWLQGLRKQKIAPLAAHLYAQQLWRGLSKEEQASSRQYWQKTLQQLPDGEDSVITKLLAEPLFRSSGHPTDKSNDNEEIGERIAANRVWNEERKAAIETLCRRVGVTPASFIYLCWALILSRLTFQKTVAFGCTFSGRGAALTQDGDRQPLGLFTNTVPLFLVLDGKWSLEAALRAIFQTLQQVQQHEKTPPLLIREETGIREDLYDSIVVFDNYPIDVTLQDSRHGTYLTDLHSEESTHFGLTLTVSGVERWHVELSAGETYKGDPVAVTMAFNAFESLATDLLEHAANSPIEDRVFTLSSGNPEAIPEAIKGMDAAQETSLVVGELKEQYPDINEFLSRIYHRFDEFPQEVSLIDNRNSISNGELLRGVGVLQAHLREAGFIPGDRVAVHLEKGLLSTQAILAILFSGGSYFYLNPKDPLQRKKSLLALADCDIVLCNTDLCNTDLCNTDLSNMALSGEFGNDSERYLLLDIESLSAVSIKTAAPALYRNRQPDGEFYFIFTSGTTGTPKGISIRNESVANLLDWFVKETNLTAADRVLGLTDLNFDPSVEDLFATFVVGATLVYPVPNVLLERQAFIELLQNESITLIDFIPGAIAQLIQDAPFFPAMRLWIFGGEELPKHLKDDLLQQGYAVRNHYGPSETTVDCLTVRQSLTTDISIGWPIQNVIAYCADVFGKPLPAGIRGELWVGGRAVAHGYTTNPVESTKYFVHAEGIIESQNLAKYFSHANSYHANFYRTGDAVIFSRESGFRYLGRIDDQVKVNGIRIEPRELELTVEMLEPVKACYLLPAVQAGKRQWHLFVDSAESPAMLETRVREHIRRHFPESWSPALIVVVDGFERTITGKIDRKRLQAIAVERQQKQVTKHHAPLTDPVEAQVQAIWNEVLENQIVATDVNFFDAGGNSLKIIALQSRMQQAFNQDIGVAVLFEYPTIASFAGWIKQQHHLSPEYTENSGAMRIDSSQQSPQESTLSLARSGKNRLADRRRKAKGSSAL
ncbi:AMP-binding protein [Xenorhabdus sp. XENO-10]|uniref:AMP-binding protein n=1 Tax=Xenorhabdus yunnanensis TaxID=3025878 RepID=A0ABT5LG80_9GAMM|nr:AMP-binding protein [Xenorhabdus yunnanensis]MDC9589593.1 AMP-binding protein [Xenorhabdus yunnanensis]